MLKKLNIGLCQAALDGDLNKVKKYIQNGADINCLNGNGLSPLVLAIENEHKEIILFLLKNGVDVNKSVYQGWTSIQHAIDIAVESAKHEYDINNHIVKPSTAIIELLLDHGADISKKNNDHQTAIDIAKLTGHKPALEVFNKIKKGKGKQ